METIDCTQIRFSDYCTPKGINNVMPHIWSYEGDYKWYEEPSNHEISNIADSIDEYISLFSPTQNQDFGIGLTY